MPAKKEGTGTEIVIVTQYAIIHIPKSKNSDKITRKILELIHKT